MISTKTLKDIATGKGTKDDENKVMLTLEDPFFSEALSWHMKKGLKKYKRGNWKLDLDPERILNALLRHANAIKKNEVIDKDSGSYHSIAIAANAMMLFYSERHGHTVVTEHGKG